MCVIPVCVQTRKPLVEKKRRARINESLQELRVLLSDSDVSCVNHLGNFDACVDGDSCCLCVRAGRLARLRLGSARLRLGSGSLCLSVILRRRQRWRTPKSWR